MDGAAELVGRGEDEHGGVGQHGRRLVRQLRLLLRGERRLRRGLLGLPAILLLLPAGGDENSSSGSGKGKFIKGGRSQSCLIPSNNQGLHSTVVYK